MKKWSQIRIEGIADIEKCVAEFNVWELEKTPYAKFKVKIFESAKGGFTGYTNIQLKKQFSEIPEGAVGLGHNIEEALENTIKYFMEMLKEREDLGEEDFEYCDPDDF